MSLEVYVDQEAAKASKTQLLQSQLEETALQALNRFTEIANQTDHYDASGSSDTMKLQEAAGKGQSLAVGQDLLFLLKEVLDRQHPEVDLTLGPVIDVWNQARDKGVLPEPELITESMQRTGMDKVLIEENKQVYLTQSGMSLDFGAVAKGYGVEAIWSILQDSGLPIYGIINAGGNIKTIGHKPDGSPWQIGLTDPRQPDQQMGILELQANEAVATSGDYQKYFDVNGKRYHHLLNPTTGYPGEGHHSVTVITENGFDSDYYSTLLFLLPTQEALALAEQLPELETIIVSQDNKVYVSSGLTERIKWTFQGGYTLVTP